METPWQHAGIYLGLTFLDCCIAYPIDLGSVGDATTDGWGVLVAAAVFSVCSVLLLGCLCCRNDKGFQEFTDSTSSHSVSTAGGYANSSAELTVFPPAGVLAIPGDRSSVVHFEPLPDIRPQQASRRPAAFSSVVSHGLSAHDWFQAPHTNFPRHQMKYVRELGHGWFGRVVEGEAQGIVPGQTTTVVVKILHEDATATDQMYFLHEVKPYRDLKHPNILRLVGRCLETDPFLVLLESCPGGDLKSFLTTNIATADALNQQGVALLMACNIAAGLHHMLDKGFVHTDLAARNCLVAPDLTVKIGDYGTSIETYKEEYYCAGDVALPIRWCAPETLHCTDTTIETKEVTASANVWSLGVVLWEICQFGKLPYAELSDDEVIVKVLVEDAYRLSLPTLPSPHRHNLYQVMKQCWSPSPQRPVLGQVLRMLNHLYASRERHKQDGDNSSLSTDEDFERRWELFKPNTIPKTDNHVASQMSVSAIQSPVKDSEMLAGHQELMLGKFRSADALLPDFIDQASVQNSSRRDSENLGSATPMTTSPQPSLSSSTGGEFFLPSIHNYHKSPSLQNLRGSIDDLSEGLSDARKLGETDSLAEEMEGQKVETKEEVIEIETASEQEFDSWLKGVSTTDEEDAKFVRKISEAIRDLDDALALEKTSSSSSDASSKCASNHSTPAKQTVVADQNVVLDFRLGKTNDQPSIDRFIEETFQPDSFQEDSLLDLHRRVSRGTDSGTDTEDETWRRRVEQGEFTKKVKEKSKSVADLMVLTHIECSDGSDSDTPSLVWSFERSSYHRSSLTRQRSIPTRTLAAASGPMYGSDSNIHGAVLGKEFKDTLEKLCAARMEQDPHAKADPSRLRPGDIGLLDQYASCSEETLLNFSPTEESPLVKKDVGENCATNASYRKDNNFLSFDASDKVSQSTDLLNTESQTGVGQVVHACVSKNSVLDSKIVNEVPDISDVRVCDYSLNDESGALDRVQVNKTYDGREKKPECDNPAGEELCHDAVVTSGAAVDLPQSLDGNEADLRGGNDLSGSGHFVTSTPIPKTNRTDDFTCNVDSVVLPFPVEGLQNLEESTPDYGNGKTVVDPAGTSTRSFVADSESSADVTSESCQFNEAAGEKVPQIVVPDQSRDSALGELQAFVGHEKASVIIGPCEDYTLDYFKGLKTTFIDQNRMFSSLDFVAKDAMHNCNDEADFITDVDYSIDPWDRYMENDNGCGSESPSCIKLSQENNCAILAVDKSPCNDMSDMPKANQCSGGFVLEDEAESCSNKVCDNVDLFRNEQQDLDHVSGLMSNGENVCESQKIPLPSQTGITDVHKGLPYVLSETKTEKANDDVYDPFTSTIKGSTCEGVQNKNSLKLSTKDASPSDLHNSDGCESNASGDVLLSVPTGLEPRVDAVSCVLKTQVENTLTLPRVNLITATPVSSGRNSPEACCSDETQRMARMVVARDEGEPVVGDGESVDMHFSKTFVISESQIPNNIGNSDSDLLYPSSNVSENSPEHLDATDVHAEIDDCAPHVGDVTAGESGGKGMQTADLPVIQAVKEQALSSCPLSPRTGEKGRLETCDSSGTEDSAFDFPRSDDVSIASSHCRDTPVDRPDLWECKEGGERSDGFVPTMLNDVTMPGVKINVESFQGEYQINRCEVGAQLDEDGDEEFGLDIAKHSTPDDERSSDSGFRDKGSLSESCEDACDEKYHLEDIEAELEETFNRGGFAYVGRGDEEEEEEEQCGHEECAASQSSREDVICSVLLSDPDSTMQMVASEQDDRSLQLCDSNEDSLEGTMLATPSQNDELDNSLILSFIVSEQKHTELSSRCLENKCASQEVIQQNEACLNETYALPPAGSGWYLHPPVDDTRRAVQADDGDELPCHSSPKSCSSTGSKGDDGNNSDNSYVSFSLDEEFVTAIRNELREKLSCGLQRSESEGSEAEEEEDENDDDGDGELVVDSEDDVPQEERTDITIHYNTYPASLSPILEEGESMSSLTTTLSDQFSPFLSNTVVAADGEHEGPVFVLDLKKDGKNLGLKKFEDDIREALANCSLSSEDTESSSAKETGCGVLVEDLDPQTDGLTMVLVRDTAKRPEEDDLLMVDVETNKAVLLESPTPKSHLAFVQNKRIVDVPNVSPSIGSSDGDENIISNSDTFVISSGKFEGSLVDFDATHSPKKEGTFTPDRISPDVGSASPASLGGVETPNTDNMSDYFLTPDVSAVSSEDIVCVSPVVESQFLESEVSDRVEEIHLGVPNNEAAEIISDLESGGFIPSKNEVTQDVADGATPKTHEVLSSDSEHVEMLSFDGSSCSSEFANQKLSELASSMLAFTSHQQAVETSDSNDSSYLSPEKRQQDCFSAESSISELSSTEEPSTSLVRNQMEMFLQEERDWSKPSPEAVLLSTKAPMPSPEEEAWKKLPSVLALSDLSNVMARCSGGEELEEASYQSPSQPYGSQDDDDMMSTSFSNRDEDPDCYTPDWESESEDTNEDDNSSSSGEFIWKDGEREERVPAVKVSTTPAASKMYEGLGEFPMEAIVEEEEDDDGDDVDESSSSGSGTEFVPSAWNSRAIPGRSALRSPDKKSEHKKSVSFKRQKYHCVYEYPREISDSETEGQDRQHWNRFTPQFDYSSYADWELDGDAAELTTQDLDNDVEAADCHVPQQFDFYKLSSVDYDLGTGMLSEGDFFTSSSSRPFTLSLVSNSFATAGTASQFFPGHATHRASEDADVDSILLDFVSGDEERDACDDEIDTSRGGEDDAPLSPLAAAGLGELRHTRDRLKLDLGAAGNKRAGLEPVQGEASLLDSGIESGNGAQSARTMQAALESAS